MAKTKNNNRIVNGSTRASTTIILAHGAGAAMDTDFMESIAVGLADLKYRVVRFEFPYMAERRISGKQKPPNREPVLRSAWLDIIKSTKANRLVIGGKSMGGRIASLIADEAEVDGLVCLGYPFHPVGKPEKLRTAHLEMIKTPTLIVQGERDPFGTAAEVAKYKLSKNIDVHWLPDGDHSFKPRKSSGHTLEENLQTAIGEIHQFVGRHA